MGVPALDIPNFRLLRPIGAGGAGAVYLAEQFRPRRKVAVKIISPEDLPQKFMTVLKKEGDVVARFEHDNLVNVIECGVIDDHYYLVEQYLGGGDLGSRVAEGITPAEAVSVILAIASALAHIHERGYVHRDVKPGNILFSEAGKPVLADFGLAKAADTVGMLTQSGYTSGTPAYMSPEQIKGETLDGRSDLYSLGVVFYELLAGQRPFVADSDYDLRKAQVEQPPPRLPAALSCFQSILDRLLAKVPAGRYAEAGDLIRDLEQLPQQPEETTRFTPQPAKPEGQQTDFASVTTWVREMSRRRVFRVMALYLVTSWGITEALTTVSEYLRLPDWTRTGTVVLFIVGFPIAMALAWLFDIGPGGVRRAQPGSHKGMLAIFLSVTMLLSATVLVVRFMEPPADVVDEPVAVATPGVPSIAVLAFDDIGPEQDKEYFADGLSETLIHVLAQIQGLKVTAKTSSFYFKGKDVTISDIARQLGVAHVLEGSILIVDDRIRVIAQLIDASDGSHVWSRNFDRELQNIFEVQDEIAAEVVTALEVALLDTEEARLYERHRPSFEAYEQVILGRQQMAKRTSESLAIAEDHFRRAIELDAGYALAYVGLADTHGLEENYGGLKRDESLERRRQLIEKALQLDPTSGEAYSARATIHFDREEFRAGARDLQRAIELRPNYAPTRLRYFSLLMDQERYEQASVQIKIAAELDPMSPIIHLAAAQAEWSAGRIDQALMQVRSNIERNPEFSSHYSQMAYFQVNLGELGMAQLWLRDARRMNPNGSVQRQVECFGFLNLGDVPSAEDCTRELSANHPEKLETDYMRVWLHLYRKQWSAAIAVLEKILQQSELARFPTRFLADTIARQGDLESARRLMAGTFPRFLDDNPEIKASDLDAALVFSGILHANGETDLRDNLLRAMENRIASVRRLEPHSPGYDNMDVSIYAIREDRDRAIASLRDSIGRNWRSSWWLFRNDWKLGDLREDPEFVALIDELETSIAVQRMWYQENKDQPLPDL